MNSILRRLFAFFVCFTVFLLIYIFILSLSSPLAPQSTKLQALEDDLIRGSIKESKEFLCYDKDNMKPKNYEKIFPIEIFCIIFTEERK